jgi:hypothetical protein
MRSADAIDDSGNKGSEGDESKKRRGGGLSKEYILRSVTHPVPLSLHSSHDSVMFCVIANPWPHSSRKIRFLGHRSSRDCGHISNLTTYKTQRMGEKLCAMAR